jgi:hypothetical protein
MQLYELPNSSESLAISGGVHIFYLFFVTLHIGGSFALIMLPESLGLVKRYVLPVWHTMGIILVVLVYTKDSYFHMKVPVNNVFLAITLEMFTLFVQYMWTVDHTGIDSKGNQKPEGFVSRFSGKTNATQTSGKGLDSLMKIVPTMNSDQSTKYSKLASNSGPTELSDRPTYGVLGVQYAYDTDQSIYNLNVFGRALRSGNILEPFVAECAITIPSLLIVIFVIAHRNPFDFFLQSIYLRAFLAFGVLLVVMRMRNIHRELDKEEVIHNTVAASAVTALFVSSFMFYHMLYDWLHPIYLTLHDYSDLGDLDESYTLALLVFSFVVIITAILFLVTLVKSFVSGAFWDQWISLIVYMGLSLLLFTLRFVVFIYMMFPGKWYGAWNTQDVLRHYG